jgi:hypothetical protein
MILYGVAAVCALAAIGYAANEQWPTIGAQYVPAVPTSALPTPAVAVLELARPSASTVLWQVAGGAQADEIKRGYMHYWTVLAQALRDLDASRLAEVATAGELEINRQRIQELAAERRPVDLTVTHKIGEVGIRADEALLTDFGGVASTEEFPARATFVLVFQDNTWKVAYAQ